MSLLSAKQLVWVNDEQKLVIEEDALREVASVQEPLAVVAVVGACRLARSGRARRRLTVVARARTQARTDLARASS